MKIWFISALGICTFFVAAMAWGFSASTEVGAGTPSYVSTVFDTTPNVQVLPRGNLLLMLSGSLFLTLLPAIYELSSGFHFKFRRARPSFGFSLIRARGVDLGVSERLTLAYPREI